MVSTQSNRMMARSLRSGAASILGGVLFLTSLANVTLAADVKTVIDKNLGEATTLTQNLVLSLSQGCSGGPNGGAPVNWGNLQPHANAAQNALNELRRALAANPNPPNALQLINTASSELNALVDGAHESCSGGPNGRDPVSYNNYLTNRTTVQAKLAVLKDLLGP